MKKQIILLLAVSGMLLFRSVSFAANTIHIVSVNVSTNLTCTVQVEVDNTDAFVAFQADIPIPEGLSYVTGSAQLNPARTSGHTLSVDLLGSTLRLIAYSLSNTPFPSSSGTLISFKLKAGPVPGNYTLPLTNTLLGNNLSHSLLHNIQNGTVTVLGPNYLGSTAALEFGRVALLNSGTQYLTISNSGNQNLVVSGITFSDAQFTSTGSGGFTLAAGQSRQITVVFAPTVKGTYVVQMKILSNDPDTPEAIISLKAIGFAVNELHCGSLTGASGTNATLEFTINNMEAFTGFQFDLILPSAMSYISGSVVLSRMQDHIVMANMINSHTLRIVAFSAAGKNFAGINGKILTLDFNIQGTGGHYQIVLGEVLIANTLGENILSASYNNSLHITAPDIQASNSVNFGNVSALSYGQQNLTVSNAGQEPLILQNFIFSNSCFSSPQSLPLTIQSGNSYSVPLKFSKTTKGDTAGVLQILSNDPDEYPFVVNLSGNAFVPNYIVLKDHSVIQGDTILIPVEVENEEPFVAFQFDMEYPAGLIPELDSIALMSRHQDHVLAVSLIGNNTLRIIAYSPSQKTFTGSSGTVVTIPFIVDIALTPGIYPLKLISGVLSNSLSEDILYGLRNGTLKVVKKVVIKSQILIFNTGWNIFSINVLPEDTDIKTLFMSLINEGKLIKIQDETGNSLEDLGVFGGWTNSIGNIALTEGYKIKVPGNCQFTITGVSPILPFEIPLKKGWNIIGFPSSTEVDALAVLQQLIDHGKLVKVQDETGNAIEDFGVFGGWQNFIGDFKPGEGYKIKVSDNDVLIIRE
jgi:hypothetical protein